MNEPSMDISVLLTNEDGLFIAHCLELDIVSSFDTIEGVKHEILDLVKAQIKYAFRNDNLENLYHPAPLDVWKEYFSCHQVEKIRYRIEEAFTGQGRSDVPLWLVARTCESVSQLRHA
jgi:hypothetical protein